MKVFQSGNNTLYIADSKLREEKRDLKSLRDIPQERFISFLVQNTYRRLGIGYDNHKNIDKFIDYCKSISNKDGDFKVGILDAHGFGEWYYKDGITKKSVQKWIDEHDGVYDLLLLQVCNPEHIKPIIKKSLAVVPTDIVSLLMASSGIEHLLVIPNKGTVPFNDDKIARLPSYNLLENLQQYTPSTQ